MQAAMQSGGSYSSGNPVIDAITQVAYSLGLPPSIPLSIAGWESRGSYDPTSVNQADWNGYSSVGIFQLNTAPGNPGAGYNISQLENPTTNAMLAEQRMLAPYQRGVQQGLSGTSLLDYVANNSGWPLQTGVAAANASEPSYDQGLNAFYTAHFGVGGTGVGGVPGGSLSGGNGGGFTANASASTSQVLQRIDTSMAFKGFDILHPFSYVTNNAEAIAARALIFIVGLLLVVFGLYAAVRRAG